MGEKEGGVWAWEKEKKGNMCLDVLHEKKINELIKNIFYKYF